MAKKTPASAPPAIDETPTQAEASAAAEQQPPEADPLEGTRPPAPRPPQGIVFAFLSTGNPVKDLHPRHKHVRMIDPECFGGDPYLALPIDGDPSKVRIRQVLAADAAQLLSCDPATGGQSIHRLATDDEVAEAQRYTAELKRNGGKPRGEKAAE